MSQLRRYFDIATLSPADAHSEARQRFLAAIEGKLQLDQFIKDGLQTYAYYVGHQILACVTTNSELQLSELFGSALPEGRVSQFFDALVIVLETLHTLDPVATLDDITQNVLVGTQRFRAGELQRPPNVQTLHAEHHVAFACLGWLSMLFTPFHDLSGINLRLLPSASVFSPTQNVSSQVSDIHRPVGSMLRKMGLLPISCPAVPLRHETATDSASFLKLSVLCYASLYHIGDISIIWVNQLADHCQFNLETRELRMFRFPAHCLLALRSTSDTGILTSILAAHTCGQSSQNCARDLPAVTRIYLREVLMSYRAIFGQDKRSRKLFRKRQSSSSRYRSIEDPVLQALCGRKRPSMFSKYITLDSEKDVFEAKADFPHLGERLLQIRCYSANQKPSKWRSLLLDRRDSRETFNFYLTVVIFGGISITLSLVQTLIAIITLARTPN